MSRPIYKGYWDSLADELQTAQATVAKQRELLEKAHEESLLKGWCPFCTMTEVDTFLGHEHDPDCELAKVLKDD